ncbi:hypothetical protein FA95DRAFT_214196 [Auriscalpium vulgare]|uniref:Uncharacterized protein n=1 Tax=Auriscalpium vulgare TaxID=40419 RepID=A0ACB8RM84_9AGAM|nr:hypothetical protein FA95DRAFT_214196 [Auriscalpium vulgare]
MAIPTSPSSGAPLTLHPPHHLLSPTPTSPPPSPPPPPLRFLQSLALLSQIPYSCLRHAPSSPKNPALHSPATSRWTSLSLPFPSAWTSPPSTSSPAPSPSSIARRPPPRSRPSQRATPRSPRTPSQPRTRAPSRRRPRRPCPASPRTPRRPRSPACTRRTSPRPPSRPHSTACSRQTRPAAAPARPRRPASRSPQQLGPRAAARQAPRTRAFTIQPTSSRPRPRTTTRLPSRARISWRSATCSKSKHLDGPGRDPRHQHVSIRTCAHTSALPPRVLRPSFHRAYHPRCDFMLTRASLTASCRPRTRPHATARSGRARTPGSRLISCARPSRSWRS